MAVIVGKLKKISDTIPHEFLKGKDGKDGIDGRDGRDGKDGQAGAEGTNGKDGIDGKNGIDGKTTVEHIFQDLPADLVTGAQLSELKKRMEREIDMIKVQGGSSGGGGKISMNTYTKITTAEYHVNRSQLDLGTNIFGVDFNGDVNIFLPKGIDPRSIIVVNDESNTAATNNITIQVES